MTRDLGEFFGGLAAWCTDDPGEVRRYGDDPEQHAVLRDGGDRVALVIHGGFWQSAFTKANTDAVALALSRAGWTTWNVEYRRVGAGGGYPETLDDVAAACRAFRPDLAVGHSAGGQLALWAAAEGHVAWVVALAGISDLRAAAAARLGDGAVDEFLHDDADPLLRLPLDVPSLLAHGTADDRVPLTQSQDFAAAARAAGDECRLLELAGADHFDVIDPRTHWWAEIEEAIDALVS